MATNWRITNQTPRDELTDGGSFEPHMEISFRTIPEDTAGQIKVPMRLYTPENVRQLIDQYVDTVKAVNEL